MDKILSIDFVGLPTRIMASKKIRTKFFKYNDILPQKYLNTLYDRDVNEVTSLELKKIGKGKDGQAWWLNESYIFNGGRLCNKASGGLIVRNPKIAGKERWIDIDGQKFYNQGYNPFTRRKIVDKLHSYWQTEILSSRGIAPISPIYYPLFLEYKFKGVLTDAADVDNYALPYYKTLQDSLVKTGIIKNDTWRQIKGFTVLFENTNYEDLDTTSWGDLVLDNLTLTIYATKWKETSVHSTGENSESDQH